VDLYGVVFGSFSNRNRRFNEYKRHCRSLSIFHDNIEQIMPGQASVTAVVGSQKSFVLKKIMNIPPPNILADQDDGKDHKTC